MNPPPYPRPFYPPQGEGEGDHHAYETPDARRYNQRPPIPHNHAEHSSLSRAYTIPAHAFSGVMPGIAGTSAPGYSGAVPPPVTIPIGVPTSAFLPSSSGYQHQPPPQSQPYTPQRGQSYPAVPMPMSRSTTQGSGLVYTDEPLSYVQVQDPSPLPRGNDGRPVGGHDNRICRNCPNPARLYSEWCSTECRQQKFYYDGLPKCSHCKREPRRLGSRKCELCSPFPRQA